MNCSKRPKMMEVLYILQYNLLQGMRFFICEVATSIIGHVKGMAQGGNF